MNENNNEKGLTEIELTMNDVDGDINLFVDSNIISVLLLYLFVPSFVIVNF